MDQHALSVIEFARVIELIAGRAISEPGAQRVRTLVPGTDREFIEREHARVAAVRALRGSDGGWGPENVPAPGQALAKLRVAESSWVAAEAHGIAILLTSASRTRTTVRDPKRPAAAVAMLAPLLDALVTLPAIEKAITRAIDDDGKIRDDATPALRRIRRELRDADQEVVGLLQRVIAKLDPHHQVADASVTIRNGRYVIPVRRDARTSVGGIVHDTSATGGTLFIEPPAAIEASNRIRELAIDEQREIDRILRELTDLARPYADELAASLDALTEIDSLHARAKYADDFGCVACSFGEVAEALQVREGRHPLLLAQGAAVVAFDLSLSPDERTLLISGPNTGGKTVLLKALGLFHAMAQSGIPIPAGQGTVLLLVDDIFADVGDEQSIEASLSTFSAHLRNLRAILGAATSNSLVLIDELGSGTDPAEGAALGAAILEDLTMRGARTVATTHLGALKDLPVTVPGIVNASLQFDEVALAPTYRLLQGIPGRSYGLSIARRLHLPEHVIRRAEERVPEQERAVSALLSELEKRETELDARAAQLATDEANSQEHGRRVAERERAVKAREREFERQSRADARRFLLEARGELERAIASVRAAAEEDFAERARAARKTLERGAEEHATAIEQLGSDDTTVPATRDRDGGAVEVGSLVEVESLGGRVARVIELRGSDALVAVGAIKMTVPVSAVSLSARQRPEPSSVALGDLPELEVKTEVDVRGTRVSDVDEQVLAALDAAVRADLRSLRIIHGKGTGALRERVAEMLAKDGRAKSYRLGAWNEGGAGVTIAELA